MAGMFFVEVDTNKRLIHSDELSVVRYQIGNALNEGEDLVSSPFVLGGEFCQWVTSRNTIFHYQLVTAHLPTEFEDRVRMMGGHGYELAFEPVNFNGMICQWMQKPRALIADAKAERFALEPVLGSEFRLVEHVKILGSFSFSSLGGA